MDLMKKLCLFLSICCICVVEVASKYKTILISAERKYQTVIDCGTNAAIGIRIATAGFVEVEGPCAKDTDKTNWIQCVKNDCKNDEINAFESCQGDQLCRVQPEQTVKHLHTCSESNFTNVLHIKYRCSRVTSPLGFKVRVGNLKTWATCRRNATAYVIVSGILVFLVIVLFIVLFIKLRKPAD